MAKTGNTDSMECWWGCRVTGILIHWVLYVSSWSFPHKLVKGLILPCLLPLPLSPGSSHPGICSVGQAGSGSCRMVDTHDLGHLVGGCCPHPTGWPHLLGSCLRGTPAPCSFCSLKLDFEGWDLSRKPLGSLEFRKEEPTLPIFLGSPDHHPTPAAAFKAVTLASQLLCQQKLQCSQESFI